jgi:NADPH-dependent 2,4-dienoyl-CoA reductase/sulfur reductase-like enzyme
VDVIKPPKSKKSVAVIGGGPAGMKAALTAAERGHSVTLYEKNGYLGGLLRHADFSPYKWALRDYKDYLVREVKKNGITVHLNTEATPDMIRAGGYDTVLAAIGAEPVTPKIPGADGKNVWNFFDVYGREKELGKNVVFIGGGEYGGVETGMFLARSGHRVTVLTSSPELLPLERVHYPEIVMTEYDHLKGYDYVTEAIATRISNGKVTYTDAGENEQFINADDVVIYGGLRPRQAEALSFYGSTKNATTKAFFTIGDCSGRCGDVQKSIRSAFFTASLI